MDPNVAKMIERSRARNSAKKKPAPASTTENHEQIPMKTLSPTRKVPINVENRSPLKPRNFESTSTNNLSPKKKAGAAATEVTDSPSDTIRRMLSRDSLETSVQELLSRDSPGKLVKTYTSTSSSPTRTTITKTVVTETEEKYERTKVVSVSGDKEFVKQFGGTSQENFKKLDAIVESSGKPMDSPGLSRFIAKEALESPKEVVPDTSDYLAGRKARLANLANKFKNMEDDPRHFTPGGVSRRRSRSVSPVKTHSPVKTDHIRSRSPIKTVNQPFISSPAQSPLVPQPGSARSTSPTKIVTNPSARLYNGSPAKPYTASPNTTAKPYSASPGKPRTVSPVKPPVPSPQKVVAEPDASFVSSLKAQGFSESESASKLIYDFEKRSRSPSPVAARRRSPSPAKSPSRRLVEPQEGRGRAQVRPTVLSSPTKTAVAPTRSVSPSKPHPLQFVSSQVSAAAAAPPKPSRTYEAAAPAPAKSWVTKAVPASQAPPDDRCDTPSRRSVMQKKTMFEGVTPEAETVDPALMSLNDRKKLFEKNKSVPTPVARFGESVTPAMLAKGRPVSEMTPAEAWKRKREQSPTKHQPPPKKHSPSDNCGQSAISKPAFADVRLRPTSAVKVVASANLQEEVDPSPATPHVSKKAAEIHKKLFEKKDWRDNDIAKDVENKKKEDMELLLNRYNHLKSISGDKAETAPPPPPAPAANQTNQSKKNKESPEKYYPGVNSLKRVKVSPPKTGSLYPEIYESDTMSSRPDSVMSSDTMNSSFESIATVNSEAPSLGRDIVNAARKTAAPEQNLTTIPESNDSMDTEDGEEMSESAVMDEIDDMLDDAMDDSVGYSPRGTKGSSSSSGSSRVGRSESTTSWEFHTPQPAKPKADPSRYKTPLVLSRESPGEPEVQLEGVDGPIMHTVSFYRKQRPANTPVQRVVLNPVLEQTLNSTQAESPRTTISQRIKLLQEEANQQMSVISQASSALNLCRATKEFFGSAEQVEGERLLLVATHKRTAALNEISKLKTEAGLGADPDADNSVRGTVSINSISLVLKKDFVNQLRRGEADDFVHYFLCLIKCAGQVIPTQMVSTLEGLNGITLDFPNLIKLTDLPKNFVIQLEVYGLQTKREVLDHESKYHIKKEKSVFSSLLTPSNRNKESRLTRPEMSSPGGPHSVRTSSFAMVGNMVITVENLKRKEWRLESVPHVSPLDGALRFQLNCHSESQVTYRGFLTMFDDVSGFGAWHRRWFVLEGNRLAYWKYPENQKTQEPIGTIDLGGSITETVSIAPREICSRMHTFLLESRRPGRREDRDSLVLIRQGATTIIRHLLSADSREERLTWSAILNQALENLRAWDPTFSDNRTSRSGSVSSTGSSETLGSAVSTDIW